MCCDIVMKYFVLTQKKKSMQIGIPREFWNSRYYYHNLLVDNLKVILGCALITKRVYEEYLPKKLF